jgi:hypothetical protein
MVIYMRLPRFQPKRPHDRRVGQRPRAWHNIPGSKGTMGIGFSTVSVRLWMRACVGEHHLPERYFLFALRVREDCISAIKISHELDALKCVGTHQPHCHKAEVVVTDMKGGSPMCDIGSKSRGSWHALIGWLGCLPTPPRQDNCLLACIQVLRLGLRHVPGPFDSPKSASGS